MKQHLNEIKRMQQLAGIITENEVMTEESKFSNFVKNIFTSKADKEKAASTAIAAEKAAEAAIRLAKSKEEIEKINSLTNDATFKNLLNDYSSKYYEAYFNLENSAWLNTGDRANVGYWLHELDPLAKPLKDFLKSKGIDPELIIDFSTAMLTNLQSQKQKTNESRMQQLAGIITESEYQESQIEEDEDQIDGSEIVQQYIKGGSQGDLDLNSTNLTSLPDNLTVNGSLDIGGTKLKSLPNKLTVMEDLYALGCDGITQLPKDLKVGGDLNLTRTSITSLPDGLKIGGGLRLSKTKITSLPNDLTVTNLYLNNTPITSLPDNLNINGDLDLDGIKITSLPNNLTVKGELTLRDTPITSIPKDLKVGKSLNLSRTPITELPDNLTINGSLDLNESAIKKLPNNLTVRGSLYLFDTEISELPDTLKVGGTLDLRFTPLNDYSEEELQQKYPKIKGKFYVTGVRRSNNQYRNANK